MELSREDIKNIFDVDIAFGTTKCMPEIEEIPTIKVKTARNPATEIFKILLIFGFNINERKIINDGTARSIVAKSNL